MTRIKDHVLLLLICCCFFLTGCDTDKNVSPNALSVLGESVRCGALDSHVTFQFSVSGKTKSSILGKSESVAVGSVDVVIALVQSPEKAEITFIPQTLKTDAGGKVSFDFSIGEHPGIYKLKATLKNYPEIAACEVTVLGGISLFGAKQDGWVGNILDEPIKVFAEVRPGVPQEGVHVEFDLRKAPKKTKLFDIQAYTNVNGVALANVHLGSVQGGGLVGVRVLSAPWVIEDQTLSLHSKFFVIDRIGLLINVLGGLAIFIFGMRLMSDGLSLIAGDRLRSLLNMLTKNRFAAVCVGTLVTGAIQSSSACSVMVIGFVNAGLIRLEQAIGVIMGANIGTTITAQMISFKLNDLALPAIFIGVVMSLVAKRKQIEFCAQILIGFGLLFLGMTNMAGQLKQMSDSVTIHNIFDSLSCMPHPGESMQLFPVLKAIAAGTLITVVIQSSSAAIGLLLTLASTGLIDIYTATAVLLGDNIGTTITAVLAAIGSSRTAKRTACSHVLFNLIGTALMVVLFYVPYKGHPVFMYVIAQLTAGDSFAGENLERYLANAHTGFNVCCTLIFVWFITIFARIARWVVPGKDDEILDLLLDPNLVSTPAIALEQAWREVGVMIHKSSDAVSAGMSAVRNSHGDHDFDEMVSSVQRLEQEVDELQAKVTNYISHVSQESLTEDQAEMIPSLLHSVNDAERLGDHAMYLVRLARRVRKRSLLFSAKADEELAQIQQTVMSMFRLCSDALGVQKMRDGSEAIHHEAVLQEIEMRTKQLKNQSNDYRKAHLDRQDAGECADPRVGAVYLELLQQFYRMGTHLHNIIEGYARTHH